MGITCETGGGVFREENRWVGEGHGDGDGDQHGYQPVLGRRFAMAVEGSTDWVVGGEARWLRCAADWVEEVPQHDGLVEFGTLRCIVFYFVVGRIGTLESRSSMYERVHILHVLDFMASTTDHKLFQRYSMWIPLPSFSNVKRIPSDIIDTQSKYYEKRQLRETYDRGTTVHVAKNKVEACRSSHLFREATVPKLKRYTCQTS